MSANSQVQLRLDMTQLHEGVFKQTQLISRGTIEAKPIKPLLSAWSLGVHD